MSMLSGAVSTEEASRLLGVSLRRIEQMAESGQISRIARGLIDRSSVERYLATRAGERRTRTWAERTAWAAIAQLSGERADWLGQVQASRLRSALRQVTDAADLVSRLRNRARLHTYAGHAAVAARLRADLVTVDRSRLGLVTGLGAGADGYLATTDVEGLAGRYALRADASGSYLLRATTFDLDVVARLAESSTVLAAVDAAGSLDSRERGVGRAALTEILEQFHV